MKTIQELRNENAILLSIIGEFRRMAYLPGDATPEDVLDHYREIRPLYAEAREAAIGKSAEVERLKTENARLSAQLENAWFERLRLYDELAKPLARLLVSQTPDGVAITFPDKLDAGELVQVLRNLCYESVERRKSGKRRPDQTGTEIEIPTPPDREPFIVS